MSDQRIHRPTEPYRQARDPARAWDDLPWPRSLTKLPLILRGRCHPEDVRRARDHGVDGIYCSNHGGRQANGGLLIHVLRSLPAETDLLMAVDGYPALADLTPDSLRSLG
nr:alpha-hydroxy-acid oxidizing protein [Frankia sp. EI5c]